VLVSVEVVRISDEPKMPPRGEMLATTKVPRTHGQRRLQLLRSVERVLGAQTADVVVVAIAVGFFESRQSEALPRRSIPLAVG
jgi:hypothetical protein